MAFLKAVLILLPLLAFYLYRRVRWARFEQYKNFVSPPADFLWGHAKLIHEYQNDPTKKAGRHSDYVFQEIHRTIGGPPIMALDFRPMSYAICVVCSHAVAEQVARPSKTFRYSVPKSPTMSELIPLVGSESVLRAENDNWKMLRKRFNPGFQPQHLISLLPQILAKTDVFLRRLDGFVKSGEVFALDELCVDLTFDIIAAVVMDIDFRAQQRENEHEIASLTRKLLAAFDAASPFSHLWPPTVWKRKRLGAEVDHALKKAVRQKFNEIKASGDSEKSHSQKGRSVIALSFEDVDELTEDVLQQTTDNIKTFLFAGHDTTAITLQWAFYELSRSPRAMATLKAELDAVLGPDTSPKHVADVLLSGGEEVLQRLTYLSAVIKEILRLYPPAGSARMAPPGSGFTVRMPDGTDKCIDGMVVYICHYIIQRDPAVFGDTADVFMPERWLGDTDTGMTQNVQVDDERAEKDNKAIPPSAWRPFERGPRNCIGQELANLEARVILACAVRKYEFEKVGMGEIVLDEKDRPVMSGTTGQFEVREELINRRQITSKPFDGMMMRVKLAGATR